MAAKEKFKFVVIVAMLIICTVLFGCASNQSRNVSNNEAASNTNNLQENTQNTNQFDNTAVQTEQIITYTLEDIKIHSSKTDCWMAIEGKVYDVTSFSPAHPGGQAIFFGCGKDASVMFAGKHSQKARDMLPNYYIGDLIE